MDTLGTPATRVEMKQTSNSKYRLAKRSILVIRRVIAASPRGGHCVVEHRACALRLTEARLGLQLCHCFGRAKSLDDKLMTSIEYNWGMARGALNVDSRWNCFYAGSDFHSMFDDGMWCLLPTLETLQRYEDASRKDKRKHGIFLMEAMQEDNLALDSITQKVSGYHTYTLVAFHAEMKKTPIHRHNVEEPGIKESDITRHIFPFNEPEPLEVQSHLHPKFVILSLGLHLTRSSGVTEAQRNQVHVSAYVKEFTLLQRLYRRWTERLQVQQLTDPHFLTYVAHPRRNSADTLSYTSSVVPKLDLRRSERQAGVRAPAIVTDGSMAQLRKIQSSGGRVPIVLIVNTMGRKADDNEGLEEGYDSGGEDEEVVEDEVHDGSDDEGDDEGKKMQLQPINKRVMNETPNVDDPSTPSKKRCVG